MQLETTPKTVQLAPVARYEFNLARLVYTRKTMKAISQTLLEYQRDTLPMILIDILSYGSGIDEVIDLRVEGTSMTKRVRAWLYKNFNVQLNEDAGQRIGEICGDAKGFTCEVDVTNDFDWNEGDFGDMGSCFFGGREYQSARCETLPRLYASALRFYRKGSGIGRCWIVPVPARLTQGKPAYLLLNYYGVNVTPTRVCAVMENILHNQFQGTWTAKPVDATFYVDTRMYVNGAQPYIVFREEDAESMPDDVTYTDSDMDNYRTLPDWAIEGLREYQDNYDDYGDDDY